MAQSNIRRDMAEGLAAAASQRAADTAQLGQVVAKLERNLNGWAAAQGETLGAQQRQLLAVEKAAVVRAADVDSRLETQLAELQAGLTSELAAAQTSFTERTLHLERQAKADTLAAAK